MPLVLLARDGAELSGDEYGTGPRGVVLAHGGRFNKDSWKKQAEELAGAGFRVVAFDFRGYGQSRGPGQADVFTAPLQLDVLAAVRYLWDSGVKSVSVVGGSLGGGAAADAAEEAGPALIGRVVLLGSGPGRHPEKLKGRKLLIIARDDANADGPRLPKILPEWKKVPEPKDLIVVEGSAHAQFLFETDQGERVMKEILRFLSEGTQD